MPEAVNPSEGYTANWNNKAGTADDGENFGREHRVTFILERLAAENAWDRQKQRQLNKDVAGLNGSGNRGRYLVPRLRDAVDAVGNGGNPDVDTVLAALEAHQGSPEFGRAFVDPVNDTRSAGEEAFISSLINQLATDIYGDELSGAVGVPGGARGLAMVLHAIDAAAGDVTGSYSQEYAGDYFNGTAWEEVVRDALSALASGGIPADAPHGACEGGPDLYERCTSDDQCTDDPACTPDGICDCVGNSTYEHPLAGLHPELVFEPTPAGNRGTWEQIVEAGPVVNGEYIFPLGQSGLIEGTLSTLGAVDPNFDSLQPIWRDWRFVPMLHVGEDLEASGSPDPDGDGVWDGFERWYFGNTTSGARQDHDGDRADLLTEFLGGSDPTDPDTDDDGIVDGRDLLPQERLRSGVLRINSGFTRNLTTPDKDVLRLMVRIGPSDAFDPDVDDLTVTISDDTDTLYAVTIPAGTMDAVGASGRAWRFLDLDGTNNDLKRAAFRLPGQNTGRGTLRLSTIRTDFSSIALSDRDVSVVIEIGDHTVSDTRLWEVRGGRKLVATR
jgi:hypothetical protein